MSKIFISYSHKERGPEWRDRLKASLAVFDRKNHVELLDVWSDERLETSADFDAEIRGAMRRARLAVVLLTKQALESKFITEIELPFLRERHERDGLVIWPVVCERCEWRTLQPWLTALHLGPGGTQPLSEKTDVEASRVLRQSATEIAEQLSRAALNAFPPEPLGASASEPRVYLEKFPLSAGAKLHTEVLVGREQELALLDLAFAEPGTAIASLVAWGGVGKSMLVREWLRRLKAGRLHRDDAPRPWFGARRVYAWSFYSQGTKEDRQASEDTFLAHALEWFGVQCEPTLSPWDKGRLLADAVARERTLLILDGIEPLQYPPGPMGGQLRAPGVQSLLKSLARKASAPHLSSPIAHSLCLVTTREPLTDLADFQRRERSAWGSVLRVDLGNLTDEAGAALLHYAGAKRAGAAEIKPDDKELLTASREVGGHALTLNLLGRFLARAHGGDVRRRELVKFGKEDQAYKHVFKVLAAYETWFKSGGEPGERKLALLRMLGIFDRPANPDCINSLRQKPAIKGLTEPLFNARIRLGDWRAGLLPIAQEDFNQIVSELEAAGLAITLPSELVVIRGFGERPAKERMRSMSRNIDFPLGEPHEFPRREALIPHISHSIDTHPLLREHFAAQLRMHDQNTWIRGNRRLYDH